MPLVFVHGVSNRKGNGYDERLATRDRYFRAFLFPSFSSDPESVRIENPYWGDNGGNARWNHASLPGPSHETLGANATAAERLTAELAAGAPVAKNLVFLAVARRSLVEAVDMLWVTAVSETNETDRKPLADLSTKVIAYAEANPKPLWLGTVQDDVTFINRLRKEVDAWRKPVESSPGTPTVEVLGSTLWETIKERAGRVFSAPGDIASSVVVELGRASLQKSAAMFVGDVFVYLKQRGTKEAPGPIVQIVKDALKQAKAAAPTKKLVVIGHSMGGNILYDIFTYFMPDFHVDVFVTCGSQVALFEELKLFVTSDAAVPVNIQTDRVPRPNNVGSWINVFDTNDIVGYRAGGVFNQVQDFAYDTGKGLFGAHGSYFLRPSFHSRLCERLKGVLNDANAL